VFAEAGIGGDGSPAHPFGAIADALKDARAGDVVRVGPGVYEGFATVRAGKADAPISIVGLSAAIRGDGRGHLVEILHDYVTVQGFDISRADPPVHVFHASGVRIADNVIHDAGGECVRIKYFSTGNEVSGNRIRRCGLDFAAADHHKNGEGVYVGTAPEQLRRNPTPERDASNDNWVHDNVITSPAECVDIKEGASGNRVENNECTGGQDPDGAGFSARGSGNVFRNNTSSGHKGAGIRLGGDKKGDGLDNVVVGNRFTGNRGLGVKVQREPQAQICGNEVSNNDKVTNGEADPRSSC
jgi:Right handed beta helix region